MRSRFLKSLALLSLTALFFSSPSLADVHPQEPLAATLLARANPAPFTWNYSIACYDGKILYTTDFGAIYAFEPDTGATERAVDTIPLATGWSAVFGLFVASDGFLYFHDNGNPGTSLYRADLTQGYPIPFGNIEALPTGCTGTIFSITEDPWTGDIWFSTAEYGGWAVTNMYLYRVQNFVAVTESAHFPPPNGGGNGPIVFVGQDALLYGESIWGGDGYFHLMDVSDPAAATITTQDYMQFPGGLSSACYGFDNALYAASGGGNAIYNLDGPVSVKIADTDRGAWGLAFGGGKMYVAEMDGTTGVVRFSSMWESQGPEPAAAGKTTSTGSSSGGCFIESVFGK